MLTTAMNNAGAKFDYAAGSAAIGLAALLPSIADTTNFFVMLSAIGGFGLIAMRLIKQYRYRNRPPREK